MNGWKLFGIAVLILFVVIPGCTIGCNLLGYGQRFANDAAETVYKEVAPQALVQKYRLLKNQAAALDEKQANILVTQAKLKALDARYKGVPPKDWPRDANEDYSMTSTELAGTKAVYNDLAAQYNAEMVDLGYKFCNVGQMPKGMPDDCQTLLKRSYATYQVN